MSDTLGSLTGLVDPHTDEIEQIRHNVRSSHLSAGRTSPPRYRPETVSMSAHPGAGASGASAASAGDFELENLLASNAGAASTGLDASGLPNRRLSGASPVSATSATNSRAVLNALRALQDKIRRLETESNFFKDSYETAKKAAQEAREECESKVSKVQSQWSAERDVLLRERSELASALNQVKDQVFAMEKELTYIKEVSHTQELEKRTAFARADELENQLSTVQKTASASVSELQEKLGSIQIECDSLTERVLKAEGALEDERQRREYAEERCRQLEAALREIIHINENLVERLHAIELVSQQPGGGSSSAEAAAGKRSLVKKRSKKVGASGKTKRAASVASHPLWRSAAATSSAASQTSVSALEAISAHRRAVELKLENIHDLLRRANKGHEIPFIAGTKAGPSFNANVAVQKAIDLKNPVPMSSSLASSANSSSIAAQTVSSASKPRLATPAGGSGSSAAGRMAIGMDSAFAADTATATETQTGGDHLGEASDGSGAAGASTSRRLSSDRLLQSVLSEKEGHMDEVLRSLQEEYDQYNRQYQELLRRTQEASNSFSVDDLVLAQSLRSIIDSMERKALQLRQLKSFRRTVATTIKEAMTPPPTFPNAEKRRKALQLYRSLKELDSSR